MAREEREKEVSADRRLKDHKGGGSVRTHIKVPEGMSLFTPKKEGIYRLSIIPYIAGKGNPFADEGELHFERTYYSYARIGANEDTYICPSKTWGKPDPIKEARAKMAKDPDADEEVVKALAPKERQLWLIYDHGEPDKGVQLWDVSFHLFGKYLDKKIKNADEDDDARLFADKKKGKILRIGAAAKEFGGNSFLEFTDIEFKPRKEALDPDLFKDLPCLDDLLIEVSYEKLKAIYLQEDTEDDKPKKKGDDEDDKPKKKKPAKDDDDDDDDDAPKKKPKKDDDDDDPPAKKKAKDDDDDEPKKKPKKDGPTAEEKGLEKGMLVIHDDFGECEILKVSGDGTSLTLEDEKGKEHYAIAPADVERKKKKKPVEDDEDDKPAKKKPAKDDDDDDDDDAPKKKKKPAKDDDDD